MTRPGEALRDEACPVCGRRPNQRMRERLAAPVAGEGLPVRYRLEWDEMVPNPEGQWLHVRDIGIKEWVLDPLLPLAAASQPVAEEGP